MAKIGLVAVDLDGTLLTSEKKLAPEGARLLKLASRSGVRAVIATTRNPPSARRFARQMMLNDPLICTNGAQVWASSDGPVWASYTIPRQAALEIARCADRNDWEIFTTLGSVTYWRQRSGQAVGPYDPVTRIVARDSDALLAPGSEPVRLLVVHPAAIVALRDLCETNFSEYCRTETYVDSTGNPKALGIFPRQADKGTALRLVCERLEIPCAEILAIGDNPNDLPMFALAGISVAMGNAPQAVKRQATAIAPSNDNEGVAWALRTYINSLMST